METTDWRIDVTDADIRAARIAWEKARDSRADAARVALLRADLERLWRAQAKQIALEFQRARFA
ncbi:MAG TPA: hypothetical protein VGK35_03985 [Actinotalea sp.]|jgi:hypothetical protein